MSDLNTKWLIENFSNKNMNLFDIGSAHISGDAMMFKTVLPNATVYAFECSLDHKEHNLLFSSMHDIKYFHCAMSDENGTTMFYPSDTYNGNHHPYSGSVCKPNKTELASGTFVWGEPYTVETIRIDTFCDTHNVTPDFIHIDVQGAEFKVLSNLGKYRPWVIWAEVNEFENCYETNITHVEFNQLMIDFGYTKMYSNNLDELYILNGLEVTPYYEK